MRSIRRSAFIVLSVLALPAALMIPVKAETPASGFSTVDASWIVISSPRRFEDLTIRLDNAVRASGLNIVNTASASEGAKAQGISIPGNRVIGVFRNDFARRMLAASIPAGIEAPIRIYLVETGNDQTILAYRRPTAVFAPYLAAASDDLQRVASELDVIFEKIASSAISP